MKNKKLIIIIAIILGLSGLAYAAYAQFNNKDSAVNGGDENSGINYTPPTNDELNETEQFKKDLGSDTTNGSTNQPASSEVTPLITAYGQTSKGVEVGSRVPKIIENNGVCTLILKKGSATIKQEKKSVANASDTSCGFIIIPRDKLGAGSWSAQITYKSLKYEGSSESVGVEVK